MNEKDTKKRREWVKNAAIIFLTIMLLLTFFSNTIMNYSLPEVATQYVQKGTITAKVRGTGNVEATDPYNVMVKETRVISAVAVKQGDAVEKDQVIYYLEDAESDELKKAEDELEELQLAYMKGLFGNNVSSEVISKVASGNTDGFSALQTKVTDMQNRLEAAKERVKECQDNLDALSLQSTVNTNNSTVNTIPEENEVSNATTKLEDAQTQETNAFEREKADKITSLTNQIAEKEKQIADLQTLVDKAESVAGSISGSVNPTPSPAVMTTSGGIDTYISQREAAKQVVDDKLKAIINAIEESDNTFSGTTINDAKTWIDNNNKYQDYQIMLQDYDAAVSQYNIAVEQVNNISNQLNNYENNENALNARKNELAELKATLEKVNA
ncbi:MAG: efflux RND transporter periplasmic adaptor subunit, partial [Lachnospiraceae bacterium]|nr:efflux RND transporter periplasmic adaptor subunit [Lachnospiraceae bacterium]